MEQHHFAHDRQPQTRTRLTGRRFRARLPIVEKVTGMVLVGTGLLVLVGAMPVIGGWLLEYAPILGRIG